MSNLANEVAELRQELESLKRTLQQRPLWSTPRTKSLEGTIKINQVGHGLVDGRVVVKTASDEWVLFDPFLFFQLLLVDPASVGALFGIVDSIQGADAATIRLSGQYGGLAPFLDIDETEPVIPGAKLYAKEVGVIIGELTHIPQPSGIVIGFVLRDSVMVVAPHRDCDAVVVALPGELIGGQVTAVTLDGVATNAADVGADDTQQVGVAYLQNATDILVAVAGSIRTDALDLIWGNGAVWLDPDTDGSGVTVKPIVPVTEEWRPTLIGRQINNRLTVNNGHLSSGVSDLWDVDATAPNDGDTIKWDDTDKRWKPGPGGLAGNADGPSVIARQVAGVGPVTAFMTTANDQVLFRSGGILQWDKIGVAQLKNTPAYTVLANGTSGTAALTEMAAIDGTVLGRVGTELKFGSNPQLGTAAGGLGYLKIHFAIGKYWEIDASGNMTVYQSATSKVEILADSSIKFTWGSSNALTIDPADIVGSSRVFKIREMDVCDSSGAPKKIQLICTATY